MENSQEEVEVFLGCACTTPPGPLSLPGEGESFLNGFGDEYLAECTFEMTSSSGGLSSGWLSPLLRKEGARGWS